MSIRRAWALAATAALSGGGCAVIAGYDFGKYGETGGSAGAGGTGGLGGQAASSGSASGPSSSSSGASSGGSSATGQGGGASSGSGATASASSGSTMASSSSSGSSGVTPLVTGLLDPEAVAVDTVNVYFTTDDPPKGPSTAGYVNKTTLAIGTPVSVPGGAPAIAAASSLAYVATWVTGSPATGTIYDFSGSASSAKVAGTVPDTLLGIAVWGQTVFFTTQGSVAWTIPPDGTPATFSTSTEIAAGPIAADATGVYWSTTGDHLLGAGLGGASPMQLVPGPLPAAVSAIATDASTVYWTDQSGGVYRVSKGGETSVSPPLVSPGAARAYGIAVDPTDSTIYFALGTEVLRLTFPFLQPPTAIATGLVDPRGVAFDGSFVYVADRGTGSSPDGRILKIAP